MSKVAGVIFDWAGTTVDFGSFAPTSIFVEAFAQAYDFELSLKEARGPMGLGKWNHIRALGDTPAIAERWLAQFGRPMSDEDVDVIYRRFMPLQIAKVGEFADLIPGTLETVAWLRQQEIKIGSCSGYPREVMAELLPAAKARGFVPDSVVATGELSAGGRPGPWMALQNVLNLGIADVGHCLKVDDSAPGIHEGRSAGMWTVGLSLSGNESGMTLADFLAATEADKVFARRTASVNLAAAGAHYIIDTIAQLPEVVLDINARLARGERP
ncbi:phosphonoacetaldehyde hydrolase [Shewanella algae]|uniref:phosphonoacetaldehyde hydrolase n=1 Tax=Shewanella algae TaxID=38313 RepID=UPI001AAF857A|nr:phosphonoacetaldehyde hydrolase [Shewanella algae]MBO2588444.1 phosphonoacetaldehyde hydrolase [Shewanella algae]